MKNRYKTLLVSTLLCATSSLYAQKNVIELTSDNFKQTIGSSKPTLVKFWASWCGPCKQMAPEFAKASDSFVGTVTFAKLNVDSYKSIANEYGIASIPTTVLFKNGKEVGRETGVYNSSDISKWANYALAH